MRIGAPSKGSVNQALTASLSLPPPPPPAPRAFCPVPFCACTAGTWPSMTDLMYSALLRYSLNCSDGESQHWRSPALDCYGVKWVCTLMYYMQGTPKRPVHQMCCARHSEPTFS